MLRKICAGVCAAVLASSAWAQAPQYVGAVEIGTTLQRYSAGDAADVRQTSIPFGASVRHQSGAGLSVRGVAISAGGDDLEGLNGLADIQASASYRRRLVGGSVEAALTARVPGGGSTLDPNQFATAAAIATEDFAFAVPTLGQGTTISPSLSVVVPAGPFAAFGVGASYFSRGSFVPFSGVDTEYAPANEIALTAGLDAQIGRASTFSLDAIYVTMGDDTFGAETFSPGDRLTGTARWAWGGGLVRGRLLMRYRHIFEGERLAEARPITYARPEHAQVATGLGFFHRGSGIELTAGTRYYGVFTTPDTALDVLNVLGDQQLLVDVGASPVVQVMPNVRLLGTFVYTLGVAEAAGAPSLSGFRAGGGLSASF